MERIKDFRNDPNRYTVSNDQGMSDPRTGDADNEDFADDPDPALTEEDLDELDLNVEEADEIEWEPEADEDEEL